MVVNCLREACVLVCSGITDTPVKGYICTPGHTHTGGLCSCERWPANPCSGRCLSILHHILFVNGLFKETKSYK